MTGSVDEWSVASETQDVGTCLRVALFVGVPVPYQSYQRLARVRHKATLGAPLLIYSRGYLLMFFHKGILPQENRGLKSVFNFMGQLPKATETHQPICQLYCWQLGPTKWPSPTTKSFIPHYSYRPSSGLPRESLEPATCGLANKRSDARGML